MIRFALASSLISAVLAAQATREIRVPIEAGRISALEVTRALLDEWGYDGAAVVFPDVRVMVGGVKGSLAIRAIDLALRDVADVRKSEGGTTLVVTIDRDQAYEVRRKAKRRLLRAMSKLVGRDLLARRYELVLPDGLEDGEPLVLCIHGLDSRANEFDALRAALAPRATATFEYANDESITSIAAELSRRLCAHAAAFPDRRIAIVAHSMGGLIARAVVEDSALDPGSIGGIMMIGTPNHGSQLAHLRIANDLVELLRHDGVDPRILRPWLDGFGEAGWDLDVGSPFLTELNARPRNRGVEYALVLGDAGLLEEAELGILRDRLVAKLTRVEGGGILAPKLAGFLSDLDEIVAGKGDGAVAVARGRLEGVPALVVPVRHDDLLESETVLAHVRAWAASLDEPR